MNQSIPTSKMQPYNWPLPTESSVLNSPSHLKEDAVFKDEELIAVRAILIKSAGLRFSLPDERFQAHEHLKFVRQSGCIKYSLYQLSFDFCLVCLSDLTKFRLSLLFFVYLCVLSSLPSVLMSDGIVCLYTCKSLDADIASSVENSGCVFGDDTPHIAGVIFFGSLSVSKRHFRKFHSRRLALILVSLQASSEWQGNSRANLKKLATAVCNINQNTCKAFLCRFLWKIYSFIFRKYTHLSDLLRVNAVSLMQRFTPDLN